jgi:hypothetical protein
MIVIGCDFDSRFQQIAMLDTGTETTDGRLEHANGEARAFYAASAHRDGGEAPAPYY